MAAQIEDSSSGLRPALGLRRARRRSLKRAIASEAKNSSTIGTAMRVIVNGSADGVATAAKTNVPDMGAGANTRNPVWGATGNPFDPRLNAGGSSGGSAAAVSARLCAGALGTDTGGSIRMPAALNGICGLRPSAGAVPNRGSFPVSPPYDTIGPMARRIVDIARVYAVIAGPAAAAEEDTRPLAARNRNLRVEHHALRAPPLQV